MTAIAAILNANKRTVTAASRSSIKSDFKWILLLARNNSNTNENLTRISATTTTTTNEVMVEHTTDRRGQMEWKIAQKIDADVGLRMMVVSHTIE